MCLVELMVIETMFENCEFPVLPLNDSPKSGGMNEIRTRTLRRDRPLL